MTHLPYVIRTRDLKEWAEIRRWAKQRLNTAEWDVEYIEGHSMFFGNDRETEYYLFWFENDEVATMCRLAVL